ncbi:MAG: hypothetical protein AB7N54_13045 [Alphaproteobacteria bacterium]
MRTALAVLLSVACATAATAGGPPPDPPGEVRVVAQTDEDSTSDCIGRPVTPLCLVESLLACEIRDDDKLCRIAWQARYRKPSFRGVELFPLLRLEYKIWHQIPFDPSDTLLCEGGEAGDVVVRIFKRQCPDAGYCHPWRTFPFHYVTRKKGERWELVTACGDDWHRTSP